MDFDFIKFHAAYMNANPAFKTLIDEGAGQAFAATLIDRYQLPANVRATLVLCLNFQLLGLHTAEDTSLILSQFVPVEQIPLLTKDFGTYFTQATTVSAGTRPVPTPPETTYTSTQAAILRESNPAPSNASEPRWDTAR
jgi:hypothetical protein